MVPLSRGPVAQFKRFMERLQRDVLQSPEYQARPAVILGHSRGGLIGRAYLGDPEVKADAARGDVNTMPHFSECVDAYATVGEICDTLRDVFGMQREFLVV